MTKLEDMTEQEIELKIMEHVSFKIPKIKDLVRDIGLVEYIFDHLRQNTNNKFILDIDKIYGTMKYYEKATKLIKTGEKYELTLNDTKGMFENYNIKKNIMEYKTLLGNIKYLEEKKAELQQYNVPTMMLMYAEVCQTKKVSDYIKDFPF